MRIEKRPVGRCRLGELASLFGFKNAPSRRMPVRVSVSEPFFFIILIFKLLGGFSGAKSAAYEANY